MSAVKNYYWDEISAELSDEFLQARNEPKFDPETVDAAQRWYKEFTGGIGSACTDDIIEMYIILQKGVDK